MRLNGNRIIFLLFFISSFLQASLHMRPLRMDGRPLEQAHVGEPFILEVSCENGSGDMERPTIAAPEECQIRQNGVEISIKNNTTRSLYTFLARIDKAGNYTLGPAMITNNGKRLYSNEVTLSTGDSPQNYAPTPVSTSQLSQIDEPAVARLEVDVDDAVLGQKINARLRFYRIDDSVEVESVSEPDYTNLGWIIKNRKGPVQGEEHSNGRRYHFIEWQWELYPTKTGDLVVPAYRIDYSCAPERQQFFSFSFLFGNRIAKTLYSNAVTIPVQPLPRYKGTVHAVGHFTSFKAQLKPAVVHEGQAMELELQLQGDGDLDTIAVPIDNFPESVKAYQSKKYCKPAQPYPILCYDYVLQARKSGEYEIPPIEFTFFDLDSHSYRTLTTHAVPFTVLSGATPVAQTQKKKNMQEVPLQMEKDELEPIVTTYKTFFSQRSIAWNWYGILVFVPFIFALAVLSLKIIKNRLQNNDRYKRSKALKKARAQLNRAQKNFQSEQLYTIFVHYCAQRMNVPETTIIKEAINQWVATFADAQQIKRWQQFFDRIEQARYFVTQLSREQVQALFKEAHEWLSYVASNS